VLTSNLAEPDWPDELDPTSGRFTYYGDNREPGQKLHNTNRFGNLILKNLFDIAHTGSRLDIPPTLIFTKESPGRAFRFRGLAVPGFPSLPATEDLIAIWKTSGNERFQNYRAIFTILNASEIRREWLQSVASGIPECSLAPKAWSEWQETGIVTPLVAPRTRLIRNKAEQLPGNNNDMDIIETVHEHFKENPFGFEACAGAITRLLLPDVIKLDLTRPWRDGGRDGIGSVRIGQGPASVEAGFALEAKCYNMSNSVGVKEVSRLISRIKHREFGILITTSFIDKQAYLEVVSDGHPIIFVSAVDIIGLLKKAGYQTPKQVRMWLSKIDYYGQTV